MGNRPFARVWAQVRNPGRAALALAALVVLGLGIRVALVLAYRPAFLGYPDSAIHYIYSASHSLADDRWHVAGYALFLRALHELPKSLPLTIVVQHALGIATAIVLYFAVRRLGKSTWVALVPAAVVLLGGDQIFFEHSVLAEPLYTPILAVSLYAAVRCMDGAGLRWPAAAGLLAALGGTVRLSGMVVVPVIALWLLAVPAAGARRRALRAGVAASVGALVIAGYLVAAHAWSGQWSFTPNGPFNDYARVATFADCTKFRPPAGTAWLCDRTPPSQRHDPRFYVFGRGAIVRRYGSPEKVPRSLVPSFTKFARAAELHQPLDYLREVARDFGSYVKPRPRSRIRSADGYMVLFTNPGWIAYTMPIVAHYYGRFSITQHSGPLQSLRDYAGAIRVRGVLMAALLVLALLAPLVCRDRPRVGSLLFSATAYSILVLSVVTLDYDFRYGVPAFGPLAAAAALGAFGIADRARRPLAGWLRPRLPRATSAP